jgi:hypothetical protein
MGVRNSRSVTSSAVAGFVTLAVAVAASGCTSKAKPILPTPVVSQTSVSPTVAPTPPPVAASSASTSVSASPSGPVLPAGCSQLLPLGTLESILGFGILGTVNYLKAAPVPQSGRTGRVTCTYGTAPGAAAPTAPSSTPTSKGGKPSTGAKPTASPSPEPLVQVSYITYTDAATAAGRVQVTIQADGASAAVSNVSVSGKPAFILIGAASSELVMSDLARTIVVELSPALVTSDKAPAALEGIAAAMLKFGAPVSSLSPSAGGSA